MGVTDLGPALLPDSTADLPPTELRALDLAVMPLNLSGAPHSDLSTLIPEGVNELTPKALPKRLRAGALSRTAQATPERFAAHYQLLLARAGSALCFPVSSTFSSTYASALQAVHGGRGTVGAVGLPRLEAPSGGAGR